MQNKKIPPLCQIKAIAPTAKTGDRFIPVCDELLDEKELDHQPQR